MIWVWQRGWLVCIRNWNVLRNGWDVYWQSTFDSKYLQVCASSRWGRGYNQSLLDSAVAIGLTIQDVIAFVFVFLHIKYIKDWVSDKACKLASEIENVLRQQNFTLSDQPPDCAINVQTPAPNPILARLSENRLNKMCQVKSGWVKWAQKIINSAVSDQQPPGCVINVQTPTTPS